MSKWWNKPNNRKRALSFTPHDSDTKVAFLQNPPRVLISKLALQKMYHYVDLCDYEISWLGTADYVGKGDYFIEDVFLFKQEGSAATTEISPEGLATFGEDLIRNHENGMELLNRIRAWGHSHVEMATNPSEQDKKQMDEFEESGHLWFLRLILNKRGRVECSLYHYEMGISFRDVEWAEAGVQDDTMEDAIQKEIEEKVTTKRYYGTGGGYNGANHGNSGGSYHSPSKPPEPTYERTVGSKSNGGVVIVPGNAPGKAGNARTPDDEFDDLMYGYGWGHAEVPRTVSNSPEFSPVGSHTQMELNA